MNNNQPPYGDPSWGAQGGQPTPQQPMGYAQQPMNQPVNQPPMGYDQQFYGQQAHPAQPMQSQQAWQPYQQQPVQGLGYQQGVQQNAYQQSPYQPYQQPQPYQQAQAYQQPQQYAPPQQPQGMNGYAQFNAQGQQVDPRNYSGYTGYRSQPGQKSFAIPYDVVAKVILFGVLPVLFVLAMVLDSSILKWVFLAADVVGISMLWLRDVVSPNLKLMLTLICGATAVVALVGALGGAPQDDVRNPAAQGLGNPGATQASSFTPQPTHTPTVSPDPYAVDDPAQERLESFFFYWYMNNDEAMLSLCAPSWRAKQQNAQQTLFQLKSNRIPQDDAIVSVDGTPEDSIRTATVKVSIDKQNNSGRLDRYSFKIIMLKEDGVWYVDPASLKSYESEIATPTPATQNVTPTQPVLYEGTATTVLYYNKDGGSKYHLDPDCISVHERYKPMAEFYFSELGNEPYSKLTNCNVCGAPLRPKAE